MNLNEVMQFLEEHGSEQTKKVLIRHGASEPFFGVKISDLTKLQKKIKKDHDLALKLYKTGNTDAMYLAGMIAEPGKMNRDTLEDWAEGAYWYMLSDYTIATVAAKSDHGFDLALEWIDRDNEFVESAGWATLSNYISYDTLDKKQIEKTRQLLERAKNTLQKSKNRVRYTMNGFIIACGAFEEEFFTIAVEIALKVGKVKVDMGDTACKVPDAEATLLKIRNMGKVGVKRKK